MDAKRFVFTPLSFLLLLAGVFWMYPNTAEASAFKPPANNRAPRESVGGASRGAFIPSEDNSAPRQAGAGASRGAFVPPSENQAPRQAGAGASRGAFIPPSENQAPRQAGAGASRGTFVPSEDNSAPRQAASGASRGTFVPSEDNSAPRQAASGGARSNTQGVDSFENRQMSMIALLPDSFYGTTLSSHPTILVYVPNSTANEAVFSLKHEDKNLHYQMSVPISGQAGIIAIALPESAPPLEVGQNYQWYLALKLGDTLSPSTPFVDGWVKRITPSAELARLLVGKTPVEKSSILATNGVWYDSASILAELRRTEPTNPVLLKEWTELLDSVELSQLIDAPL